MHCSLAEAGQCHSCPHLATPYPAQLAAKDARVRALLAHAHGADMVWESPAASAETAFRNKAKLAAGGTLSAPTLGIVDADFTAVDLASCPLYEPAITALIPTIRAFITRAGLSPYNPAADRGELKYVHITASPNRVPLIRFVLRSTEAEVRLRKHRGWLLDQIAAALGPGAAAGAVVSMNLLPQRAARTEGAEERMITENAELEMALGGLNLRLRPGAFFQTNTAVAAELYRTAGAWVGDIARQLAGAHAAEGLATRPTSPSDAPTAASTPGTSSLGPHHVAPPTLTEPAAPPTNPASSTHTADLRIWDVYCGVGGFALAVAGPGRQVLGIESSAPAVAAARSAAQASGLAVQIVEGDAEAAVYAHGAPDVAIVNPPRRGIGDVAPWLDSSPAQWVLYSSCNPESLAADLAGLESFELVRGRVFDMFPHTDHVEVLAALRRRA